MPAAISRAADRIDKQPSSPAPPSSPSPKELDCAAACRAPALATDQGSSRRMKKSIDARHTSASLLELPPSGRNLGGMSDSDWPRNRLLLALPPGNLKRLRPELKRIVCTRELVLMDADSSLDHVFFPDSGVVSILAVYADGGMIEMATVGREGCTGVQAALGAKISSAQFLVQIPGGATKMSRETFMRTMQSMPAFRSLMYAYARAFLEQVMVSVACNGAHSLKERLARWLLMMRDRGDDDTLPITQTLLAQVLGVQRPPLTNCARELEHAGLIECGRGEITIRDRQGLTEVSCECYQLVRGRVAFHLPRTYN